MFNLKEYQKTYYQNHKEQYKKYYKEHKKEIRKSKRKWTEAHPEWQKNYQQKFRLLAFKKLGNKCTHCGFSDIRALQIDHVHGHGNSERKRLHTIQFYKKVIVDTNNDYQLLCANCNWIKRHEKGEHD
jgi:hypothetical protein